MGYITKDDLEEYIDIIPSENGDDDYDTRTVLAKNIFEWLKDKKFKQDLEYHSSDFGVITTRGAAERVQRLIEILEEVGDLLPYDMFEFRPLVVDINDWSSILNLTDILEKAVRSWGDRELVGYNKGYKIKEHTKKSSRIGLVDYEVAADSY